MRRSRLCGGAIPGASRGLPKSGILRHILFPTSRKGAGSPGAAIPEGQYARVLFLVSGVLSRLRNGALDGGMDRLAEHFFTLG